MGTALSTPLWDPFTHDHDHRESLRGRFQLYRSKDINGGASSSTSNSSLGSSASQREPSPSPGSACNKNASHGYAEALTSSLLMGTNAPLLYEHALVGDWTSLKKRISTHPKEARYQDKCKNTPLHVSCRRQPPVDVIAALMQAHPSVLLATTLDGLTPLHFCCYCGSEPPTVQVLLQQPQMQNKSLREMVDRRGRTPLHCVCAGFRSPHRLEVISMLLKIDPSCAMAGDERGRSPLSLIIDDYAEELQEVMDKSPEEALNDCETVSGDLYECWQVTTLLLRAAYCGTIQETPKQKGEFSVDGEFQILHAALGVGGCPPVFIRLILKVLPKSIELTDSDLNLPLHIHARTHPKHLGLSTSMHTAAKHLLWKSTSKLNSTNNTRSWNSLAQAATYQSERTLSNSHSNLKSMASMPSLSSSSKTGVVYNADFGRSSSFTSLKTTPLPSLHEDATIASCLPEYFSTHQSQHDVTVDLLLLYTKAARMKDEFGKLPFLLAVESGKPWKTCLEPLYQSYPGGFLSVCERSSQLEQAIDCTLANANPFLRNETCKSLKYLSKLWPSPAVNEWVLHLIGKVVHPSAMDGDPNVGVDPGVGAGTLSEDSAWRSGMKASFLKGLASVLSNVNTEDLTMPDTPRTALDMATPLLSNEDEEVRIGAAQVIGASVALLGRVATGIVLRETVLPEDHDKDASSFFSAVASTTTADNDKDDAETNSEEQAAVISSAESLHGRAMTCYYILLSQPQELPLQCALSVKEWIKDEDVTVRMAACLAMGATLAAPQNEMRLKEFRSVILKSMRATEDVRVHMGLARGLALAAKKQPKLFLCKSGLSILDGALLLSMTTKLPWVQHSFDLFLWWALVPNNEAGLKHYMEMAPGENGHIMMTLVAKTLQTMHIDEDED